MAIRPGSIFSKSISWSWIGCNQTLLGRQPSELGANQVALGFEELVLGGVEFEAASNTLLCVPIRFGSRCVSAKARCSSHWTVQLPRPKTPPWRCQIQAARQIPFGTGLTLLSRLASLAFSTRCVPPKLVQMGMFMDKPTI